jgi:hypothetical protein
MDVSCVRSIFLVIDSERARVKKARQEKEGDCGRTEQNNESCFGTETEPDKKSGNSSMNDRKWLPRAHASLKKLAIKKSGRYASVR